MGLFFIFPLHSIKANQKLKKNGLVSTEIPSFNLLVQVSVLDTFYNKALERLIALYL